MPSDAQPQASRADSIGRRTLRAVFNLTTREAAIKVLAFAGWIVLARALQPELFGLFALASFSTNLFNIFSEVGLGAAFVRSREEVPRRALDSLFTYQLVWFLGPALLFFLCAPVLAQYYGLPDLMPLLQALAVSFILISLRTAPSILLQRRLQYGLIAISEVLAQATYWAFAIIFALAGLGVWALVFSVISFGLVGTGSLYVAARWRPALQFDWSPMRGKAGLSLMYHGQSISSLAKYGMLLVVGGAAFGPIAVGYVTWAHQVAVVPALLTLLVTRVSFPALAQVQGHSEEFGKLLSGVIVWTCRLTFPACALLMALAPEVTQYIYGAKWLQALPSFYMFAAHTALWAPAAVLITALYSLGRGVQGLRILIGMTLVAWLGAALFAYLGVGEASLALGYLLSGVVALGGAVYEFRSLEGLHWLRPTMLPLASTIVLGTGLYWIAPLVVHGVVSLVVVASLSGTAIVAANLIGEYSRLIAHARSMLNTFSPIRGIRNRRAKTPVLETIDFNRK
jgi:O-antigen/teichoic acid export membrane protein